MLKKLIAILLVLLPLSTSAQVFSQSQLIITPYNGVVFSTTTTGGSKLSASSTPYFSNFLFGNATGSQATTTKFFATLGNFTTLCIALDCKTAWPSTGGGGNSKWATSTVDSTAISPNSADWVGIGTTTPKWLLQLSTSTRPQLTLSDPSTNTNTHWSIRNAGGNLYFATSSPLGNFSTSSNSGVALTISTSSFVGFGLASGSDHPNTPFDFNWEQGFIPNNFMAQFSSGYNSTNYSGLRVRTNLNSANSILLSLENNANVVFSVLSTGIASSSDLVVSGSLVLPQGASPTVNAAGELAVDTSTGQLKWYDGQKTQTLTGTTTKSFNIASTTLDASGKRFNTGTSTFLMANLPEAMTMTSFYCTASTTGTAIVQFGDPSGNYTEAGVITSGQLTRTTTNNTWTAYEGLTMQASSTSGLVSRLTCTVNLFNTAD